MSGRRSWLDLVGEALREAGVLTAVFVTIDSLFQPRPFPILLFSSIGIAAGGAIFFVGVWFERFRKQGGGHK
jgi:hypothetical protein